MRWPRIGLIAAVAVLVGFLIWLHLLDQRTLAEQGRAYRALQTSLARANRQAASEHKRAAAAELARASLAKQLTDAGKAPPGQAAKRKGMLRLSDFIHDHPEFAAVREQIARRNMLRTYGDALDRLHLPPDQLEKLKQLLTERSLAPGDTRMAAMDAGLATSGKDFQTAVRESTSEIDAEITTLVGQDTAQQLQQTSNYKWQTDNVAMTMKDIGVPMTSDQNLALQTILAQTAAAPAAPDSQTAKAYREPDPNTGLSPQDQAVLQNSANLLSPPQLGALRQALLAQHKEQAMYTQAFKGSGGSIRDD